ncbi:MFS transporter [Sphingomonas sp. SUN039]|uniref:MFS transporter n=1 Tax=Sphingomonas sp. SUN039 TaxID=2937787 RepID=UPI002164BF65|nr:MFS transporter [Sphingomonas sp. SUN039]UVO52688.1 MFS transporter [Sphingomonas sp. SUN039]
MTESTDAAPFGGTFAPLRERTFRTIWSASLLSNFGQLILAVGAAWEMTRLTSSPSMVALVQTASMLPLMLVAVPAGAIADMFDRRRIAMSGLALSSLCGAMLTALAFAGLTTPWVILAFCALIGAGVAIYAPAWQASISEQVEGPNVPAAIALGTISSSVARSFGPAIGGFIVLAAGAKAAFAINALFYLPLLLAFFFWKRRQVPSRLPPERLDRAIVSGMRYIRHSGPIRTALFRTFMFGLAGATATALAPLIAKDLLRGNADTYGILLGAGGVGAVTGALLVGWFRNRFGTEGATRLLAIAGGLALVLTGFSRSLPLTCLGLFIGGGANILTIALFNISVQTAAPRWVTARALSLFTSALTGGIAIGAVFWGVLASMTDVQVAVVASGVTLLATALLSVLMPLPESTEADVATVEIAHQPEVGMALTMRSGPVVIEIDYDVDPDSARDFYMAMLQVQRTRLRNGGFDWSMSRDIANPALWTERYKCPTWGDYLRMRDRFSQADIALHEAARSFHRNTGDLRIRRKLERPFGSVRWKADTPDPRHGTIGYIGP